MKLPLTRISFGSASAIITNMALITGLSSAVNAKVGIIDGLFVIAIADNLSDSLGIHIFQESEGQNSRNVWISTFTNFVSRLIVSLGFVIIVALLPLNIAILASLVYGLAVLSLVSRAVAERKRVAPLPIIVEHAAVALVIVLLSKYLGGLIVNNASWF